VTVDWHGELYYRNTKHYNSNLGPREEWDEKAGKMTAVIGKPGRYRII